MKQGEGHEHRKCGANVRRAGQTVRYHEDIGLIEPLRSGNAYRAFREGDVHTLSFLGKARSLGFTIDDCRALLGLYGESTRESADVKRIAEAHLRRIDRKIVKLRAIEIHWQTWSPPVPVIAVPTARF